MTRDDFLTWIFEYCEDGQVETRALPEKKQAFHELGDWGSVSRFCDKHKQQNLYFAMATRNGGGTKADIVEIPVVWVDVDFKDVPKDQARESIWNFRCRPQVVIESGGGYHVYWRLSEPLDQGRIPRFERLLADLATCLQGDPISAEAARILRLPETINHKPQYNKPVVTIAWDNRVQVDYALDDLEETVELRLSCEPSKASTFNEKDTLPTNSNFLYKGDSHERDITGQTVTQRDMIPDVDFSVGHHDNSLFSIAYHLAKGGMGADNVLRTIEFLAHTLDPDKETKRWAKDKTKSAFQRIQRRETSLAEEVRAWVRDTSGTFSGTECDKYLGIVTQRDMVNRRKIFQRLADEGLIERVKDQNNLFRRIETECEEIDFLNADTTPLDVRWPLGEERYFNCHPKNIIITAGEQDSGKSAYCLNTARLNMNQHKVFYFSSEMGPSEVNVRLRNFDDVNLSEWKVKFFERSSNFVDVIRPDDFNIIDFLEIHDSFYQIGGQLKAIHDKLKKGIALIALQKAPGAQLGRGGSFSLEKPRLYLTMSKEYPGGRISIEKCKNWANPGYNPNGLTRHFMLVKGCKFVTDKDWQRQ